MGGRQSSVRSTHFQRPQEERTESGEPRDFPHESDHHISISNKMVERLVEDAALAGGAAAAVAKAASAGGRIPRGDQKDNIYIEKLKYMDESHSQKYGLNIEDVNALAKRIELRTAVTLDPEPVCAECSEKVVECYTSCQDSADVVRCWDTVGAFRKCVQDAAVSRLRARTEKEAREYARLSRHMAHAREHALKDLAPPPPEVH